MAELDEIECRFPSRSNGILNSPTTFDLTTDLLSLVSIGQKTQSVEFESRNQFIIPSTTD